MSRRTQLIALCATGLAASLVVFLAAQPKTSPTLPAPTEIVEQKETKRRIRRERQAWIESLHWAAPGTDWRAIETTTRRAHILERQALLDAGRASQAWTELGSANQAGRTHATAFSTTTGALYVGSDKGGVWKGDLTGANWTPISDGLGFGSHHLAVATGTPEVITTATNNGTIHASTNDGASWFVPAGLPDRSVSECTRIWVDPDTPHTVYLLVRGSRWDGALVEFFNFMLRSTDGGQTYTTVHTEPYNLRADFWMDRTTSGPLYLLAGADLKRSIDQGATFTLVGSVPATVSNVALTGSEAGAPTLYAAVDASGWQLWRSTDAGATWEFRYGISDWWHTLCASITNPDLVLFAGVEAWRSTSGGASFAKVNNWWDYYNDPINKLHADNPGMECRLIGPDEFWFLNTDGGTYISVDGVASVINISLHGLGISQYYSVFTSQTDPYLVAAGAQDQGYQQSLPATAPYLEFDQLISGDYGHMTSTVRDHNLLYSVYPGFMLVQKNEAAPQDLVQVDFPSGEDRSWMPNITSDPDNPEVVYLCADYIHKYERSGPSSWSRSALPQLFGTGSSYLTALAISAVNRNYWYAITNTGVLWYSHDDGATWTASPDSGPGAHYFYGTDIVVSPTDPTHAWVGGSGYSGPAVYATQDGSVSWTPMSTGLPSTLVYQLALDNAADQNLYAAAEAGPYAYNAAAGSWESILGTEAPLTVYWAVEGVPELGIVRFGTYGRGIWDYDPGHVAGLEVAAAPRAQSGGFRVVPHPAGTSFAFDLSEAGHVSIEVYDVTGRRLAAPFEGRITAGQATVPYDLKTASGRSLPNGVFLVRATTPDGVAVEKLHVVR